MKKYCAFILFLGLLLLYGCTRQKTEFTIWIGGAPQELDYWEKLIGEFEEKTGYDLLLVRQPTYSDQRKQGLIISLEAKQPNPDLFLMDVVWINQFIRSGWLEPLDENIRRDRFSLDPFFGSVINTVDSYRDTCYAFPVFVDVSLLYYRRDLLTQSGYDTPPDTWAELIDYSQKIQAAERDERQNFNGFVWQGAQYEGLVCTFLEFLASNGGVIIQDGKIELDTEANAQGLQLMQDLIHKYKISPPNTYTEMKEEEVRQAFQRGDALFERNWTYAWKLHNEAGSPVKGKVGVSDLPHFENHRSVSAIGGWHLGVSRYSDVKEKAWEFVKFVTSYETQKKLMLNVGWTPGRKDVYEDADVIRELPHAAILKNILETGASRPNVPYYTEVSEVIQRFVNNCLADKMIPREALSAMQKKIDQITRIYEPDE